MFSFQKKSELDARYIITSYFFSATNSVRLILYLQRFHDLCTRKAQKSSYTQLNDIVNLRRFFDEEVYFFSFGKNRLFVYFFFHHLSSSSLLL